MIQMSAEQVAADNLFLRNECKMCCLDLSSGGGGVKMCLCGLKDKKCSLRKIGV